jgi:hypothetical protein
MSKSTSQTLAELFGAAQEGPVEAAPVPAATSAPPRVEKAVLRDLWGDRGHSRRRRGNFGHAAWNANRRRTTRYSPADVDRQWYVVYERMQPGRWYTRAELVTEISESWDWARRVIARRGGLEIALNPDRDRHPYGAARYLYRKIEGVPRPVPNFPPKRYTPEQLKMKARHYERGKGRIRRKRWWEKHGREYRRQWAERRRLAKIGEGENRRGENEGNER